jgi:hypothetical protein
MAAIDQAQVFGGHTARVVLGPPGEEKEYGFFYEVNWSVDYGLVPVNVLGQTEDYEHQQTRYKVSGDFRRFRIRDEIIDPGKGLLPTTSAEAIRKGVFHLDIIDKVTNKVVTRLEFVTLGSGSEAISSGQLVSSRVQFQALNTRMGINSGQ